MVIVRLLPEDGSLDETFGDDGIVVNSLVGGFLSTVAIQPDGKIVIGAQADIDHAAVFRYLEDGTLDPDFGATGAGYTVGPYVSHWNGGMGMALDGEGRIVIGEYGDWTFVRYQADGSVDTGFGDGGIVEDELPETRNDGGNLSRFVIDSSNRIVAVGDTEFRDKDEHVLPGFGSVVAVTRYNEDGSPDTSLAGTGRFYVPFLDETGHWFNGVRALTLDGERIVLAATYYTWTDNVFFLLRLNGDGTYDTNFGPDGNGFSAEAMLGWETHQLGLRIDPDGAYRVPFAIVRDSSYETIAVGAARTLAE
jgi:uncharacterized delta-60 repeat protein